MRPPTGSVASAISAGVRKKSFSVSIAASAAPSVGSPGHRRTLPDFVASRHTLVIMA
jgi:hypothetical protein